MDRRHQPHKLLTVPVKQMETHTLYQDTFVPKEITRVQPVKQKGEYQPPNDYREMQSEHAAEYTEKGVRVSSDNFQDDILDPLLAVVYYTHLTYLSCQLNVDRKGRPFEPYSIPGVKMDGVSQYTDTFEPKEIDLVRPFIPKGEYEPPNDDRDMLSEHMRNFQEPPVSF